MFTLNWDDDFNLKISCDENKLTILSEFSKVYNQYEKFAGWMDNNDVPEEQKKPYTEALNNARVSFSFLYGFMNACGISDKEIQEYTEIPF